MSLSRHSSFITRQNRQLGFKCRVGEKSASYASLALSIKAFRTWDPRRTTSDTDHGGVFNFGFSKNGTLLGVALERKSVLLFDAFNGNLVARKTNAHTDCVNCVKFLDDRLFATCSDDTTVALWDMRYLKHNIQTFRGHSNWVKNIEYDSNQGVLLTSGFDGSIYTWNINKYSTEDTSSRVFHTSGLMRSKLSPDFSKLVISTHEGYIIIIHNLDLSTLSEDLKGFKPNMYRLMQRSQTPLKIGLSYNHVFEQERNRVEFITDWPKGNDANIISSLQVHPQGWCILSRNTDASETSEWTCVHDLQSEAEVRKTTPRPWEVDCVTPHTSSAFCSSTSTPAYSSLAPSRRTRTSRENQAPTSSNHSDSHTQQLGDRDGQSGQSTNSSSAVSEADLNPRSRLGDQSLSEGGEILDPASRPVEASAEDHPSVSVRDTNSVTSSAARHVDEHGVANVGSMAATRDRVSSNQPQQHATEGLQNQGEMSGLNNNSRPSASRNIPDLPLLSGSTHNSLIQIRRGARQEDGSFSFSISVHTSSGRTVLFDQHDLESDDDDDNDVRIERIIPNLPRNQNSGNTDRDGENLFNYIYNSDNSRNSAGENEVNADGLENAHWDESDMEQESEHDILEEGEYDFDFNDGDIDHPDLEFPEENQFSIEIPGSSSDSGNFSVSIGTNHDEGDGLFRNTGPSRIRRSASNRSSRNTEPSSTESRNQAGSSGAVPRTVRTVMESGSSRPATALDTRPQSNSFMFVLESNSGTRRRRVLNLSYLDTYTEPESKLLQKNIHSNKNRLQGFVKECNVGKGFIKEVAFSSDGRLISSPFGFGIRLFSFDSQCNELCDCVPSSPVKLYESTCILAHTNYVVATQFSPVHNLVVSGCLDGKIAFHQPVL